MTSVFEERFIQRKQFWFPAFLALFIAFISVQTTRAAYFRPQMVFVQSSAPIRVDTNGDGQFEAFSADYIVYEDGTAEGSFFLDDDYEVVVESGSIGLGPDGELIVTVKGTNLEHELGHTLGFRHEHTLPSGPAGGGGDILVFDIVDAVYDQNPSPGGGGGGGIIIDYDIVDAANHSATFSVEAELTIR